MTETDKMKFKLLREKISVLEKQSTTLRETRQSKIEEAVNDGKCEDRWKWVVGGWCVP